MQYLTLRLRQQVNFENEKWKDLDGDSIEVLAWMPLPKAYKESEVTKNDLFNT